MSDTSEDTGAQATAPGQILKRAREAKNLTVAAIATLMNLDLRTIEALERGEQSDLPAPIFVRGYLRGYARLVGVAEVTVLEAYKAQAPQDPLPRSVGMSRVPMRPAFRARMIPWKGVLLSIVALLGVWFGMQWWPEISAQFNGDTTQQTQTVAEPDAPFMEQATTEPDATETPQLPEFIEPASPAAGNSALELPLPAPQPAPATDVLSDVPPAALPAEPELPADTDFAAVKPESADASLAVTPAAADELRLELHANEESWVEVRTADGKSLVLGLLHKGDTRSVAGKALMSVVLGNAAGVEIKVDGKSFDHHAFTSDNIARFEIKP